ncbi:MAG: TlpA family protein disulfide reductase [Candidatus Ventricola sp.]
MRKRMWAIGLALVLTLLGAVASAEVIDIDEAGLRLTVENRLIEAGFDYRGGYYDQDNSVYITLMCVDPDVMSRCLNELKAAQQSGDQDRSNAAIELYLAHLNDIVTIFMRRQSSGTAGLPFDPAAAQDLGEHNGYHYWAVFEDMAVGDKAQAQSEAEIAAWQDCAAMLSDLTTVIGFIPVRERASLDAGTQLPAFSTQDLAGNAVTEAIFAQKDITVVNFWGTFCGPCINEMPELGEWARAMPDNVQIIGILTDVMLGDEKGAGKAVRIMDKAQADFTNLVMDDALNEYCASVIVGVPTTILVNREGVIVGDAIVGANVGKYKAAVEAALRAQ